MRPKWQRTQKNRATEYHLGQLKAKFAKLRTQLLEPPKGSSGGGEDFVVTKFELEIGLRLTEKGLWCGINLPSRRGNHMSKKLKRLMREAYSELCLKNQMMV